jgi:hypothetical protein
MKGDSPIVAAARERAARVFAAQSDDQRERARASYAVALRALESVGDTGREARALRRALRGQP